MVMFFQTLLEVLREPDVILAVFELQDVHVVHVGSIAPLRSSRSFAGHTPLCFFEGLGIFPEVACHAKLPAVSGERSVVEMGGVEPPSRR